MLNIIERRTVRELGRVKIEVQHVLDDDGCYDWLGEFCDYDRKHTPQTKEQKLVHRESRTVLGHDGIWRDSHGRIAPIPCDKDFSWRREYQYTFHNNGHEKIAYALVDSKRLDGLAAGDWCFLGIRAVVTFSGTEIG